MIRTANANRLGFIAAIAMSLAGTTALDAGAQGKVRLNGGTGAECSYSSITVAPNGDLTVTCSGTTGGLPACSISGPASAVINTAFTLTANCTNGPTAYAWTGTGTSGSTASQNLSIAALGSYTFTVAGTNATGAGPISASHTVTITAAEPPPIDVPRNCSISTNPAAPKVGDAVTITMSCTNSPNAFAWYQFEGAAAGLQNQTTTSSQTVTFTAAGTYSWYLQAGNALGSGDVFVGSVAVTPATVGNCPVVATVAPSGYENNWRFDLKPGQIGSIPMSLPIGGYTSAGATVSAIMATKQETPASTVAEIAIAPCAGQFDVPAECKMTVYGQGGMALAVGEIGSAACKKPLGGYFVNIKHTTCVPYGANGINYCSHWVKFSGKDY
jgi:hypothetical protein